MRQCTEEQFLKDVAEHQMTVLRDDGICRHVRFRKNASIIMGFDLITWPGYLCVSGDMGCWVFSRLPDMFEFFRCAPADRQGLYINTRYWAEKCQAADTRCGLREYSAERFISTIRGILDEEDASPELREAVEDAVIRYADEVEVLAREAAENFVDAETGFRFHDLFEYNFQEYTYQFVWICYAIAWGIQRYDALKAAA